MPSGCCSGASCSCQIVAEGRLSIEGSGQPSDPFILDMEADFESTSNESFDTIATGTGYLADPWRIETRYASSSQLDHIPDVDAPTPTNGQVLSWNSDIARWVATSPTVAPTGAVQHDTSLSGDGSPEAPLAVAPSQSRYVGTFPNGVGLNDQGMASVVHHFTNEAARTAALPVPWVNSLSMLDTDPGVIEYWSGAAWFVLPNQTTWKAVGGEFLQLSGGYTDGLPITVLVTQVDTSTDTLGVFDILDAVDLTGMSGVLAVNFQETGTFGWKAVVFANVDKISAKAYWMTDGSIVASSPVTGTVQAICY